MRNLNLFKHLRTKLTVLYVALFVAVLSLISAAVYVATTRNVEQMVRQQLVASSAVFANLSATRNTRLREEADILARDFGFRDAVASSDQPTIRSALTNLSGRFGVDLAFVITLDGRVTAKAGGPTALPAEVVQAVATDAASSGAFTINGVAYEAVAAPIMAPDLTGWVVFGSTLGPQSMTALTRLSAIPLNAVVVGASRGGWAPLGADKPADPALKALIDRSSSAHAVQTGSLSGPDGLSVAVVQKLPRFGDAPAIAILLTCPLAQALKPYEALGVTIALFGLLGVALVVVGSWLLARTLTQPISALETAAKLLQRGESARVTATTGDEIASLGVSFNAMADDIEDREAALKKAKDTAEAANRAKSMFLANMNHEVRTPLNGVLGVAGMLATTPLDHDQRQMVELIEASGVDLQRILNDVLDMVDLGANQLDLVDQPFDLGRLARGVVAVATDKAQSKYLPVHLDLDPEADHWVRGDAVRVEQILTNLLDNAVKFTERGRIDLRVDFEGEDAYRFEIKDTGIGFNPAKAEDLFTAFNQADGSMTRRAGGTGLGLSLARDIARAMGGGIIAHGAMGEGGVHLHHPSAVDACAQGPQQRL
jgi:signal transduction histidine kinase